MALDIGIGPKLDETGGKPRVSWLFPVNESANRGNCCIFSTVQNRDGAAAPRQPGIRVSCARLSTERRNPLRETRKFPRCGVLVDDSAGDSASHLWLDPLQGLGGVLLLARIDRRLDSLDEAPDAADSRMVDRRPYSVAADALLGLRRVRHGCPRANEKRREAKTVAPTRAFPYSRGPRRSTLAFRAIKGRTSALNDAFHGSTAAARPALAVVDDEGFGEIAELAVGADEVLQAGAACVDGFGEHLLDGADQPPKPFQRDGAAAPLRVDFRAVQRLANVNVAEPGDDPLVAEQQLDRGSAAAQALPQLARIQLERLGTERLERRPVVQLAGRHEIDRPEPPRIVECKALPLVRFEQQMVVLPEARMVDSPTARHSEVEDHRVVAVGVDQPVFRAAAEARHPGARQALAEILRERASQVRPPGFDARDSPAFENSGEATDRCLDFGKLGHGRDMAKQAQAR